MNDVAVTRIGNQNFKIMSCEEVAFFKGNEGILKKNNIQELIKPLACENYDEAFIQNIALKVKDVLLSIFDQPDGINKIDFKSSDSKEYKILLQKVKPVIFGFLLHPLSDSDMREIERNSVKKTYFTGDLSDISKTKEDFNQ